MKYLARCLGISMLLASTFGTGPARATPLQVVFDNATSPSGGIFGPECCHVGNEVTLGGNARRIVRLSWLVDSQDTEIATGIEVRIYANDGPGGAPDTLLWESGLLTGIQVSATDSFLDVAVPEITVPDIVTVTSRILDSAPVALGRRDGGPPIVGSINASWVESAPGQWHQDFGPWGMRIAAVPETPTISLMIMAGVLLVRLRRWSSPFNTSSGRRDAA